MIPVEAALGRSGAEEFEEFRVFQLEVSGFAQVDACDLRRVHFDDRYRASASRKQRHAIIASGADG